MKKFFTSAVLLAAALFTANAQQLQTGDQFTYTNAEGVEKTYIVTGENLIENPSFDNNTTGWVGGGGGNAVHARQHNVQQDYLRVCLIQGIKEGFSVTETHCLKSGSPQCIEHQFPDAQIIFHTVDHGNSPLKRELQMYGRPSAARTYYIRITRR